MKRVPVCMILVVLLLAATQALAQEARRPQTELYAGVGIPLAPESFKKYYKVGLSAHGQYVIFPSPTLGLSLTAGYERFMIDSKTIEKEMSDNFTAYILDQTGQLPSFYGIAYVPQVEGSASDIEFGAGLRPYLTRPEASRQLFLFGMATVNMLRTSIRGSGTVTIPNVGIYQFESKSEENATKMGLAGGVGMEMPAGESNNIVVQGVFRFIFTEGDMTEFLGVTAGIVY